MSVATTIMHHPEPSKERAKLATLGITTIEIHISTWFTLL